MIHTCMINSFCLTTFFEVSVIWISVWIYSAALVFIMSVELFVALRLWNECSRASVEIVSMAGTVDDVVDLGAVSIDVTAAVRYLTGFRLADDTIAAVAFIAGTCPASDASDVVDDAGADGVP